MATAQPQQHDEREETEVRLTLLGRLALAVDLLERAAKMIGVPTTQEELDAYIEAKRRYDAVESSSYDVPESVSQVSEKEAEANLREQWTNYCAGW